MQDMNYPESKRTMIGGQLESQRLPIDRLIDEIFRCVTVGNQEDELMGVDLPEVKFDRNHARSLIQDFVDKVIIGKSI